MLLKVEVSPTDGRETQWSCLARADASGREQVSVLEGRLYPGKTPSLTGSQVGAI